MKTFADLITIEQARPVSSFKASTYFPRIGDSVTLTNQSKYQDTNKWTLFDGTDYSNVTTENASITVTAIGDVLVQNLFVQNTVGSNSFNENLFPIATPIDQYLLVQDDLIQTFHLGDTIALTIIKDPAIATGNAVVTGTVALVNHSTGVTNVSASIGNGINTDGHVVVNLTPTVAAIYDVIITSNTVGSTKTIENKAGMRVTVYPAIQPIEAAFVHDVYPVGSAHNQSLYGVRYSIINGLNYNYTGVPIAPGRTIILNLISSSPDDRFRIWFSDLKGTAENPIVVTCTTTYDIKFESYWGLIFARCEHVIVNGAAYKMQPYMKVRRHPDSDTGLIAVSVGQKSTNIKLAQIEISDVKFCGIQGKTDPNKTDPSTWRGAFTMYDFNIHNCYIHDTAGEGQYVGYFDSGTHTYNGQTYRAHEIRGMKNYRNRYVKNGWDAIQINNATQCEIAHNYIYNAAWYGEPNQATAFSGNFEGSIHDNLVEGITHGLGFQIGALGALNVYNNVISGILDGASPLFLLSAKEVPEQNTAIINGMPSNEIPIKIFNNALIGTGKSICINAQNVCQYRNVTVYNNLYSHGNVFFGGQDVTTIALWESLQSNNYRIENGNQVALKIASIPHQNFNIGPDSILATGGKTDSYLHDVRGYKNWNSGSKFIGPHSGLTVLSDMVLQLLSVNINNSEIETRDRNVFVTFSLKGNPTHYRIAETADMSEVQYIPIVNSIPYTLSLGEGTKTVYLQVRNATTQSNIVSDTINYIEFLRFYVNLSSYNAAYDAPSPYNNFRAVNNGGVDSMPVGYESQTFKNQYLESSTLKLTVIEPFDSTDANYTSTITNYPYDNKAIRHKWVVANTNPLGQGKLRLSGCNVNKEYDILLYAKRYNGGICTYKVSHYIDGNVETSQNYNFGYNDGSATGYSNICMFTNLKCRPDGTIDIAVALPGVLGSYGAQQSLIEIRERTIIAE